MLHILNITRSQFMLSNNLQVKMNMKYLSTPSLPQQYKPSNISHIILIRRHTQKQQRLPHQNATNSRPSAMPDGVFDLVVQSKKGILLNCSNSSVSLVFSSVAMEDHLHVNKFLWSRNHGYQCMYYRTPIPEVLCQRHFHSRSISWDQNIQQQQGSRSMGSFSELKRHQELKPHIKYDFQMS